MGLERQDGINPEFLALINSVKCVVCHGVGTPLLNSQRACYNCSGTGIEPTRKYLLSSIKKRYPDFDPSHVRVFSSNHR